MEFFIDNREMNCYTSKKLIFAIILLKKVRLMRKITILCVGNLKEKYWQEALGEYKKRLAKFCELSIIELPESRLVKNNASEIDAVICADGDKILEKLKGKKVFPLTIEGEIISSEQLANLIENESNFGEICFVIGGSYGLDERVKNAGKQISFGRITLPHQLIRVVLAEQVYRAFTIFNNITYHK